MSWFLLTILSDSFDTQVAFYLQNVHILPRKIYLCLNAENDDMATDSGRLAGYVICCVLTLDTEFLEVNSMYYFYILNEYIARSATLFITISLCILHAFLCDAQVFIDRFNPRIILRTCTLLCRAESGLLTEAGQQFSIDLAKFVYRRAEVIPLLCIQNYVPTVYALYTHWYHTAVRRQRRAHSPRKYWC